MPVIGARVLLCSLDLTSSCTGRGTNVPSRQSGGRAVTLLVR